MFVVRCREEGCGARIKFVRTASGARMPVDAQPVVGGEWVILERTLVPFEQAPELPRYRTHYATCTNPARFRE